MKIKHLLKKATLFGLVGSLLTVAAVSFSGSKAVAEYGTSDEESLESVILSQQDAVLQKYSIEDLIATQSFLLNKPYDGTGRVVDANEDGSVVGCRSSGKKTFALVDEGDVHTLMVGAAGIGKTAFFLYPNIEFACASGMSFINTDCKGDVVRNYGTIAKKYYGYNVSVLDLRNPTRSDENNILHLVNKYMDVYLSDKRNISAKAKAEKYAKITAKIIIDIGGGSESSGANAYFYDAAEGLLASVILLLAEFGDKNERHIVSVFKLIQDLLAKAQPDSKAKAKTYFRSLWKSFLRSIKRNGLRGRR